MSSRVQQLPGLLAVLVVVGCEPNPYIERPPPPPNEGIYGFAGGCYAIDATPPGSDNTRWLRAKSSSSFSFSALSAEDGARFTLRPTDLGTYLLRDAEGGYLLSEAGRLDRATALDSDMTLVDASFVSPAEWEIRVSVNDPDRFQLRQLGTGLYLTTRGLTDEESSAAVVAFYPATGCAAFPELGLDAAGTVDPAPFADGDLFGIADAHEHLFSNYGFGGSGLVHGSAFHRLGVEHALSSCEPYHGEEGRRDLWGYFSGDGVAADPADLVPVFLSASLPEFNHFTDGYPTFTDWPDAVSTKTHQGLYYRWIERAYLGGLRLLVQHATANQVLCELMTGLGALPLWSSCNEMLGVDRTIDETHALERYIDAQSGGPGKGWFRIVTSPAEARQVIEDGKLAVILGIETSNLFDCYPTARAGAPVCDEAHVRDRLDHYYGRGVRAIFPVHKYDNVFSPGDGHRGFLELGNVINSGHYSNYVTTCDPTVQPGFDDGDVFFGGMNMPRMDYFASPPLDFEGFADNPIGALLPLLSTIQEPPLVGDYCQNATLQPLGEYLMDQLMRRGMIIELAHMPQHSYARAYEILEANDYPPAETHSRTNYGRAFALGGITSFGLARCQDPSSPGSTLNSLATRVQEITDNGGYPGVPFGFDFNGFAGQARPRFGPESPCAQPQPAPITYPFTSYAGDVTFTQPTLGERVVDFNTEGMIHIGMLPELIEDARNDALGDADLEPLFRSAEAYVRMWEKAELRGAAIAAMAP